MTNDFTRFIRLRRQELSKTQAEVASICGVSEQSITLLEAGRRCLHLERLPRLATALDTDPALLCQLALQAWSPALAAALAVLRELQ